MHRPPRDIRTGLAVALGALVLALACSDSSGPDGNGPTTGAIGGTVSTSSGGVAGAGLALGGAGTGNATTGGSGTYLFDDLAPGSYTVTITLPSGTTLAQGEAGTKPATVTAGQTATVNFSAVSEGGGGDLTVVALSGTSFSPENVTIQVGDRVRWVVNDGVHTVTPDNPGQAGAWTGTGLMSGGEQFEHTFTTAGVYNYHCVPHESLGMTGTITVQ